MQMVKDKFRIVGDYDEVGQDLWDYLKSIYGAKYIISNLNGKLSVSLENRPQDSNDGYFSHKLL